MLMEVQIQLVVISVDYAKMGQKYVLTTIPQTLILPSITYDEVRGIRLEELLHTYVSLDINWVNPKLLDVVDKKGLVIYYYCEIPHDTPTKFSTWVKIDDVKNSPQIIQVNKALLRL